MEVTHLYHEKQEGELCGVHCLNTLLQGSYFTEFDLAAIAHQLDEHERQIMMEEGTETPEFLKYMAEESGNVADSGNYSFQVLEKALSTWSLKCIPITSEAASEAAAAPLAEHAFICHLRAHWFTIRRIGSRWFDLNSLFKEPRYLSDFYLQAFLDTLRAQGWSIFVVRGPLPPSNRRSNLESSLGRWIPIDSIGKQAPGNTDSDLEAALQASLKDLQPQQDTSYRPAPFRRSPLSNSVTFSTHDEEEDDDEAFQKALEESELAAAIQASLQK